MLAQGLLPTTIRVEARHQRGLIASFFFFIGKKGREGDGQQFRWGENIYGSAKFFADLCKDMWLYM